MKFCSGLVWCLIVAVLVLLVSCSGHVLPSPSMEPVSALEGKEAIDHNIERGFSRSTFATTFSSFENSTSLLRNSLNRSPRVKRATCKDRPTGDEVMEYFDLKLLNRCWDDCDCREGRYCTTYSWCHDLPKELKV